MCEIKQVPGMQEKVTMMLDFDPNYMGKVARYLEELNNLKREDLGEAGVLESEWLCEQIQVYSATLQEILRQKARLITRDDAFAEADITAQNS